MIGMDDTTNWELDQRLTAVEDKAVNDAAHWYWDGKPQWAAEVGDQAFMFLVSSGEAWRAERLQRRLRVVWEQAPADLHRMPLRRRVLAKLRTRRARKVNR